MHYFEHEGFTIFIYLNTSTNISLNITERKNCLNQ